MVATRLGRAIRCVSVSPSRLVIGTFMAVFSLAYIVVAVHTPIGVHVTAAHDDGLFMRLGASLAQGHWLGPFSQFTLMKGPGYPAFLAAAHWLGLSVSLAHALFHVAAVTLFVVVLHRFVPFPALSALLFVLLLWHPMSLCEFHRRVIRDAIYSGQILVFLALGTSALFRPGEPRRRMVDAALSGGVLGWLWLTREEGAVLLPAIAVLVALGGLHAFRQRRLRPLAGLLVVAIAAFAVPQVGFRTVNWRWYGSFAGVDFKEVNFQRALRALHSVRSGEVRPFVSVTRSTRQHIYAVSPAFASLGRLLDGPIEKSWMRFSCDAEPQSCGEIGSGWFIWALRDAVSMAGEYQSPARASAFYGKVADEIWAACIRGTLECRPQLVSAMPPVTAGAVVARLPGSLRNGLDQLLFLHPPLMVDATEAHDRLGASLRFLNYPFHIVPRRSTVFTLHGWYRRSGREWFWAELIDAGVPSTSLGVVRIASSDVAAAFKDPDAGNQRFVLRAECADDCVLRLSTADGATVEKHLGDVRRSPFGLPLGQGTFYVDVADVRPNPAYRRQPVDWWAWRTRAWLFGAYAFAFVPVLVAGVAAFLASSVWYWRTIAGNVAYVVALTSWTIAAGRLLFLVVLDATSTPALGWALYVTPAHYLTIAAAIFSMAAWWQVRAPANMGGLATGPPSPPRSSRPSKAGALLE